MSFGSSKKNNDKKASAATAQAVAAATPKPYEDPFGKFTPGNPTKFEPTESQDQIEARGKIDSSINNLIGQAPDSFDVDSYYDNPFYQNTKQMYSRVIDQQRERDDRELTNNLSARNQMGSSYDALMRRYQAQDYNSRYDQADDQARMASANAYQQAYQNALETLRGLSNERSAALERTYAPAKIAMGYQSAVAPMQNAQAAAYSNLASYYGSRPTLGQNLLNLAGQVGGSAAQAIGAYYGAK